MTDTCLFCGGSEASQLTNEHINPLWLLACLGLPADDQLFQGVLSSETGALVEPPRIHSSFTFVQGHVCGRCNSGWMNRLEIATKPLLRQLIDESRSLQSLSASEAAVISKWAAKTAYLHTWAGPMNDPVQVSHLKRLYGDPGALVSGVSTFGMQAEFSRPSAYIQTGHWPQFSAKATSEEVHTPKDAYKIGLQYRRLYLLVAFWPDPSSTLMRVKNMHIRLAPTSGSDPEYDAQLTVGTGPIDRLKVFAESLAVCPSELQAWA